MSRKSLKTCLFGFSRGANIHRELSCRLKRIDRNEMRIERNEVEMAELRCEMTKLTKMTCEMTEIRCEMTTMICKITCNLTFCSALFGSKLR
jgi:hypothetical protein